MIRAFIICSTLLSSCCFSPVDRSIQVVDLNGKPVAEAVVVKSHNPFSSIVGQVGGPQQLPEVQLTNSKGKCVFKNIPCETNSHMNYTAISPDGKWMTPLLGEGFNMEVSESSFKKKREPQFILRLEQTHRFGFREYLIKDYVIDANLDSVSRKKLLKTRKNLIDNMMNSEMNSKWKPSREDIICYFKEKYNIDLDALKNEVD